MDGRAYLEKLISDRLATGLGRSAEGRLDAFDRSEVRGVAIGLVAAGALAQQDAEQVLADLDATLSGLGRLGVARHEASGTAGAVRPQWRRAVEDPPAPVLLDVVGLAGRTLTVGDVDGVLVSLELWSPYFVVNLVHFGVDLRQAHDPFVPWRGWDDVGTQYRSAGSSASGSHAMIVARHVFEPGPPADARVLTLVVDHPDGQVTVPMPLPTNRPEPPG
ncbi:hypothetical protein ACFYOT_31040 [Saccharothrix saharensis]|uniref:hypothetical protein n=1 Tax=Saccharothrix saharensis TaxID=571190 RepID=UPI0036847A61